MTLALNALQGRTPICMTVTLMDGLVLARSTFHHSMNYRSCVILGTGEAVTDLEEKRAVLEGIVEHIVPGRSAQVSACRCELTPATSLTLWSETAPVQVLHVAC